MELLVKYRNFRNYRDISHVQLFLAPFNQCSTFFGAENNSPIAIGEILKKKIFIKMYET